MWIALVIAGGFGCKYPDPGGGLDAGDDAGPTSHLAVHQTESKTKLYLVDGPAFGALDARPVAAETSADARVFALFEFVYVANEGALQKYEHDGVGGLIYTAQVDFASRGVSQFEDSWVVIDTKAWYFDSVGDRAFFVDLETMEILQTVSLAAADISGRRVVWTGAAQRNDDVYVGLYYEDPANPLVHETQMTVLRIDTTTWSLAPLLHDARCVRAQMIGVAPNDTVLMIGDSSYYREFGMPAAAPVNCLARIESAAPGIIDPSSGGFWTVDDYMDGDVSASYSGARTFDTTWVWAREDVMYPTLAEYRSSSRWRPHTLSIADLTSDLVSDDVVNLGGPGRTFVVDQVAYFAVNRRDDTMPGGALRADIGGGDWDEIGVYPPGELILVTRVD